MFITPTSPASFHVTEFFNIKWSAVTGAHYYLLEVDDEPTFSYPLTLTTNALTFGTRRKLAGNALKCLLSSPSRFRRQCPQPPFRDANYPHHQQCARPACAFACLTRGGSERSTPFFFDWSDTANPQVPGYDLEVDTAPNFASDGPFSSGRHPI